MGRGRGQGTVLDYLKDAISHHAVRDVVALAYVLSILVAWWLGRVVDPSVAQNAPVTFAFVDMTFGLFVLAAAYVIFGKRVIDNALETYQKLKGQEPEG